MTNNNIPSSKTGLNVDGNFRKRIFHSMKAKANANRTITERLADSMTENFGSIKFFIFNLVLFILWILVNTNQIKVIPAFDPYPFNLLTTFVSLEAIILAIFVLISQNRTSKVDDLREETDLQLNLVSEREITKLMKMMALIMEKEGIDLSKDPELKKMMEPISEEEIVKALEKEIF